MPRYQSYFICTAPRSGSTLLCKMLSETGIAGHPKSYFHRPSRSAWAQYLNLPETPEVSDQEQLTRLFATARERAKNGISIAGFRLQRHSFNYFIDQLALCCPEHRTTAERIQHLFGRTLFVHLTRRDKLAQSVSYIKAEQTGLWHRHADGRELERLAPPAQPRFDRTAIARQIDTMESYDRDWLAWFRAEEISPHAIQYDDLSVAPQDALGDLLDKLGLDPRAAQTVQPPVARLADDVNQDWIARFTRC
ncbi:Stf0 sulfotransferase family protein [Epibacterium ulvae]|uniref:Stf0 family sulfotransferase n=1 Tax=Epibacterium ulvae TaxID=1156985 RepID=UPI001BFCA253|nr:Stf0 family sulfotransferase [Epibacterium ulvae]MBT8155423.1 Stf0 sulfotransferase family protein [Epibacterium ulvae]